MAAVSSLRLFSPVSPSAPPLPGDPTAPLEPSLDWSLSQLFECYLAPIVFVHHEPRGHKQFRESLGYWAQFTGEPRLAECDGHAGKLIGAQFAGGLRTVLKRGGEPIGDNTIRKHVTAVQRLLDLAGPTTTLHERRGEEGLHLLHRPPRIPKPGLVVNEVEDDFTYEEICAILEACFRARLPRRPPPAPFTRGSFWLALFTFVACVGFREGTFLRLRWDWFHRDLLGEMWARVPARGVKGRRKITPYYVRPEAWDAIKDLRGDSPLVFPWQHGESHLHTCRRAILDLAGIAPDRRFGFHGLRKNLATAINAINPAAGSKQLGHTAQVSLQHYTSRSIVPAAMQKLRPFEPKPLPSAKGAPAREAGKQLELF